MARLPLTANTKDNQETLDDFSPIPAGEYVASITKSGYKKTKAGTGNYLQLIWKVATGKHKGKVLFDNLNLDNPNPIAVEIANKALNSICKACNKVGVQDSEELHGIPVTLIVSVQAASSTQPASNNIRGYKSADASSAVVETEAENSAAPEVDSTPSKKLPWETDDGDVPF